MNKPIVTYVSSVLPYTVKNPCVYGWQVMVTCYGPSIPKAPMCGLIGRCRYFPMADAYDVTYIFPVSEGTDFYGIMSNWSAKIFHRKMQKQLKNTKKQIEKSKNRFDDFSLMYSWLPRKTR